MTKLFLVLSIAIALFLSGCSTLSFQTSKSEEVAKKSKIIKKEVPAGYKLLKLDELHLSLVVPQNWKMKKRNFYGEQHYFIGTINDFPEARIDTDEIWDTFQTNTYNIHGVHLKTIHGSMKTFDIELNAMTPRYPIISDKDLSTKEFTVRSVLKKSPYSGYYQFYAIGSKKKQKRGVMIEIASKLYVDENEETKFNDITDKKEIEVIINSIKPYKDF